MNRPLTFATICSLSLLSGCMIGPKYTKPTPPMAPAFKEQPPEAFKESGIWKTAQPADQAIRSKRWEMFGDAQLNGLEDQLTVSNQSLKVSEARFRQARAMIKYNRSAMYPTISAGPSITNERESPNQPYFPSYAANNGTGDFSMPMDMSYEVDLWGKIRRTVNASREEAQASAGDVQTAALSLHAELAIDYFELRSADAQKQLLDDTVKAYTDALTLTRQRLEGGVAPKADMEQAQTQLDGAKVEDTDVTVMRAEYEHAIATLIGKPPAQFSITFAPQTPLKLPVIPVGLPSSLLQRRPDIAAGERRVAEANDQIGIAQTAYYPSLDLGAMGGFAATSMANWFTWPSRMWAVGGSMSETLFDAGRRRSVVTSATANYDGTVAAYRQTTLTAFQQVEDNLSSLRILEGEAQQQHHATASASASLDLFTSRYKGGVDDYLEVITAQTILLANQRNDIDIQRRRMEASVLLIKAIGGGWDATQLPKL